VRKAPSLRNNNGAIQLRVRIDGNDNFINRLGRWDDPAAVAKAQALSAQIWSDFQSGSFDTSLRVYQPLVNGSDVALLDRLRINAEIRRQKRAIHAYRVFKRYGRPLKTQAETQEFIRWAQEEQQLSNRTIVGLICEFKRCCPESKHLFQHNLRYRKSISQSDVLSTEEIRLVLADLQRNDVWYYPLFTIWLGTGPRNAEIRGLTWDCVHWEEGELLICKALRSDGFNAMNVCWAPTKTGRERIVPMSPEVKETLLLLQHSMIEKGLYEQQGLVFVTEKTNRPIYDDIPGKRWKRSLERCGFKHRRLYSQRHSFLSHALAIGNSPADLAQVAGHSTEMLLKTYAKPTGRVLMPSWGSESALDAKSRSK
jgi:integrase